MKETSGAYTDLSSLVCLQHQSRGFSFLPKQPVGSLLSGQKASRLRGRGLNFEEIRAYLPGDDIRNIDWKVTARTQKAHTRIYTEERDRPVILVVDQRINMFFGSQRAMKSVAAAEAAALAAWRVLDVGDRIGAVIFNDSEINEVRPHRSKKTVMQILQTIDRQNHALNVSDRAEIQPDRLNQVLKRTCRLSSHDSLICLVSDFDGADEQTKRLVTRMAKHNDVLAVMIFDPLESKLADIGRVVVGDGELQIEIDSSDVKLKKRYAQEFSDRLAKVENFLTLRKIPVLPINTAIPVARQLRQLLGIQTKMRTR